MSTLSRKLLRLRNRGSLKYLALNLRISVKQVTRYWDKRWIPGAYRNPAGRRCIRFHRRTISQARSLIAAAAGTDRYIRLRQQNVSWFGSKRVSWSGCQSMRDLEKSALKAGLSPTNARGFAYRLRVDDTKPPDVLDLALAARETSRDQVDSLDREFNSIPFDHLMGTTSREEFRRRSRVVWRCVLRESPFAQEWSKLARESRIDGRLIHIGERSTALSQIRCLLSQPDFETFVSAHSKATELTAQMFDISADYISKFEDALQTRPKHTHLQIAAVYLRQHQISPSAAALAEALGISRSALYRKYGHKVIQSALRLLPT